MFIRGRASITLTRMLEPHRVDLDLAAALRGARHSVKLTQAVAAVRAGLAIATLQRAELYGAASARTLTALARVYAVSVDDLRRRRGPTNSPTEAA